MVYRIKQKRVEAGLTQEELSKISGVSRATICSLENADDADCRVVSSKTLIALAKALNTTVDSIFCT